MILFLECTRLLLNLHPLFWPAMATLGHKRVRMRKNCNRCLATLGEQVHTSVLLAAENTVAAESTAGHWNLPSQGCKLEQRRTS